MSKTLEGLTCRPLWVSHLGCLKGCLAYLEMDFSDAWLFGITGHAFITNIAHDLCPSGPTAWCSHSLFELGKNAGFEVHTVFAPKNAPDFAEKQREAWTFVRKAIDAGYPCYGWDLQKPEYYTLVGYTDTGYRFHGHGADASTPSRPWHTLGTDGTGLLIVHSVHPICAAEEETAILAALDFAVHFARTPSGRLNDTYTTGPLAFTVWANALQTGRASSFGAAYNAAVWAECRKHAAAFLKEVAPHNRLPPDDLADAYTAYRTSADALQALSELFPFFTRRDDHIKDPRRIRKALALLTQIQTAEEQAIQALERITAAAPQFTHPHPNRPVFQKNPTPA